ncbi:MAG: hypothetical protein ABIJ23_02890 [Candidatus Magasanikbacteria bacterium]
MKPLGKTKIEWSDKFAYAIGLIASDGNLSPDGRHIVFTSKDEGLVKIFKDCLGLNNKIGKKSRAKEKEKKYFVIQFGDVIFYNFLLSIGMSPNKSKTLGKIKVPRKYFYHFLRGCFDGDGNICEFKHPESKNLQLKIRLFSASKVFLDWIESELKKDKIGSFRQEGKRVKILSFANKDSVRLLHLIYLQHCGNMLSRKFETAKKYMPRW